MFVVDGAVPAAVQDPDEPISERPQGLVVEIARGTTLVVVRASSWAVGEAAESPLIYSVVESPVADVSGQNCAFLARCDRQG